MGFKNPFNAPSKSVLSRPEHQSAGILEDHKVSKVLFTQEFASPLKFVRLQTGQKGIDFEGSGLASADYIISASATNRWTLGGTLVAGNLLQSNTWQAHSGGIPLMLSRAIDADSVIANKIASTNTLTAARNRYIAGFYPNNNTAVKAYVNSQGEFETIGAGLGIILASPNGTRYVLTIANGGAVVVTAL